MTEDEFDSVENEIPSEAPQRTVQPEKSLTSTMREDAIAHAKDAEGDRSNNWREQNRRTLSQLRWLDVENIQRPVKWTIGCKMYYEGLMDAAGFDPKIFRPVSSENISAVIALWLATHEQVTWFIPSSEYGFALVDNFPVWLEVIFDWGEKEFPFGPDHMKRIDEAILLKNRIFMLAYSTRAEVTEDAEPSAESESGN